MYIFVQSPPLSPKIISHYNNFWGNIFVAYFFTYNIHQHNFLEMFQSWDTFKYNYSFVFYSDALYNFNVHIFGTTMDLRCMHDL